MAGKMSYCCALSWMRGIGAAAMLCLTAAAAPAQTVGCAPPMRPMTSVNLYLGGAMPGGRAVTRAQFQKFLASVVTPRFPEGLTVAEVAGQYRLKNGRIASEPTRLLTIIVPDAAAAGPKVEEVLAAYKEKFRQESVARDQRVDCVAFE